MEENTGEKLPDIGLGNDFFFLDDTKSTRNKQKLISGATSNGKLLHSQRNDQQKEKVTLQNGRK